MPIDDEMLKTLLERGVPWPIAREAASSTRIDRDETHSVEGYAIDHGRPSWLVDRDDEEGVEGDRKSVV